MPGAAPVTIPPVTVAELLLLLHEPPVILSVKEITEPVHTADGPDIRPASGMAVTVIAFVATAMLQPFVTV